MLKHNDIQPFGLVLDVIAAHPELSHVLKRESFSTLCYEYAMTYASNSWTCEEDVEKANSVKRVFGFLTQDEMRSVIQASRDALGTYSGLNVLGETEPVLLFADILCQMELDSLTSKKQSILMWPISEFGAPAELEGGHFVLLQIAASSHLFPQIAAVWASLGLDVFAHILAFARSESASYVKAELMEVFTKVFYPGRVGFDAAQLEATAVQLEEILSPPADPDDLPGM
jgi:hypothetical protein